MNISHIRLVLCSVRGVRAAGAPPLGLGLETRDLDTSHSPSPTVSRWRLELQKKVREYFTIVEKTVNSPTQRSLVGAFSVIVKSSRTLVLGSSGRGGECRLCTRITNLSSGRPRRPRLHPQCKHRHRFESQCFTQSDQHFVPDLFWDYWQWPHTHS